MALRSADSDRLMDHGILPITKTPRTSRGKTAAVNLGPHTFKTATGQAEKDIIALNGTPTIAVMDGEGNPHYQPLRRVRTQIKKPGPRTRKHIVYTQWQIPDKPLVPPHLVGATTRIRNNSTPQERQAKRHTRRTRGLRPVPETDPAFQPAVRTSARHRIALQYLQATTQLRPAPHRRQIQFHVQLGSPTTFSKSTPR